jgi:hypothetical protein
MFQDPFGTMYALLHGDQGPLFINVIYPQSGAALLVWSLATAAVFYYVVGGMSSEYNMPRHWFITLGLTAVLCMLTVLAVCRFAFGQWGLGGPVVTLTLIQGLYAALLFTVVSFLIKWGSPNARTTPI